jgi:hypothetical protein
MGFTWDRQVVRDVMELHCPSHQRSQRFELPVHDHIVFFWHPVTFVYSCCVPLALVTTACSRVFISADVIDTRRSLT